MAELELFLKQNNTYVKVVNENMCGEYQNCHSKTIHRKIIPKLLVYADKTGQGKPVVFMPGNNNIYYLYQTCFMFI